MGDLTHGQGPLVTDHGPVGAAPVFSKLYYIANLRRSHLGYRVKRLSKIRLTLLLEWSCQCQDQQSLVGLENKIIGGRCIAKN